MSNRSDCPTVESLEELVATDPTELQRLTHEVYLHCKRYTEEEYGCIVKLNTFVTVEGPLSIHLVINSVGSEKCSRVMVSTTQARGLNGLLKRLIDTATQALPLPYATCIRCKEKHHMNSCHELRNSDYTLNFGVVCISTQQPCAIVRFCLRNIQTNKQSRWKTIIEGGTNRELELSVIRTVQSQMPRFNQDCWIYSVLGKDLFTVWEIRGPKLGSTLKLSMG